VRPMSTRPREMKRQAAGVLQQKRAKVNNDTDGRIEE
jgi:hypothetical protein